MSHSITPPLIKSVFTTDTYMCAFELQCYLSQCHSIQIPFVNSVCVHATVFHVTCCLSLHPPHHLSHSEPRTRTLCTLLLRVHFRLLPTKQSSPFYALFWICQPLISGCVSSIIMLAMSISTIVSFGTQIVLHVCY
eukprot:241707_1